MRGKRAAYRLLFYVLGMFLLSIGTTFAVNSRLGVSPVNSLPYAVSTVSGLGLGTCVAAVFWFYVVLQALLLRREFRPRDLLQVVFSGLFGYFVDFARLLLGTFTLPTYAGRLAMLAASILFISLGLTFYLAADIVPMPIEGMTLAVTRKLGRLPFHRVKIAVDTVVTGIAACVCLLGAGRVEGIREGTVIAALLTGKVLAIVSGPIRPRLRALCFGTQVGEGREAKRAG